jgi:hypothetical protein
VVEFGWTMRSLIPYFHRVLGNQFKVLFVHRHPVSFAASFKVLGAYTTYNEHNSPLWATTPFHPRSLFPEFQPRWKSMTAFEKSLHYWLEINAFGVEIRERFPDLEFMEIRSEEMFKSQEIIDSVARFTGFAKNDASVRTSVERNPTPRFSLERRPIKSEWRNYQKHPELIEFAERLGYTMDEDHVAKMIGKHQLPNGLGPLIRHSTGFWTLKANLGSLLRRANLLK